MADNTSLENQALNQPNYMAPGNVTNQQQISNFLSALKQSGAGSNNSFMSSGPQAPPPQQQLVGNTNIYNAQTNPYAQFTASLANRAPNNMGYMNNMTNNLPPIQQYQQAPPMTNPSGPVQQQAYNPNQGYSQNAYIQSQNPYSAQQGYNPYLQSTAGTGGAAPLQSQAPMQNRMMTQAPVQARSLTATMPNMVMSDETAKTNIKPAQIQNFMDNLHAWEYEYKDKADGQGKFVGPMAQELQKTGAKDAVLKGPDGKLKVDTANPRLKMFELAALAHINQQFKDMQKQFYQLKKKVK